MRVSTSTIHDTSVNSLLKQQAELFKTQQHVSTGRRILTPADDPIAATQALDVTQAASINTQFETNRQNAASSLGLVENVFPFIGRRSATIAHLLKYRNDNPVGCVFVFWYFNTDHK